MKICKKKLSLWATKFHFVANSYIPMSHGTAAVFFGSGRVWLTGRLKRFSSVRFSKRIRHMMQTLGMSAAIGVFFGRKHDKCPLGALAQTGNLQAKKESNLDCGVTG